MNSLDGEQLKVCCRRLNGIVPSIRIAPRRVVKGHKPAAHRFNLALCLRFPLLFKLPPTQAGISLIKYEFESLCLIQRDCQTIIHACPSLEGASTGAI